MKRTHGMNTIGVIVLLSMLALTTSAAAAQVSIVTSVSTASLAQDQQFDVAIWINLEGQLTVGGYIFLEYDPEILSCENVSVEGLISNSGSGTCETSQPGRIQLRDLMQNFSEAVQVYGKHLFATITFKALKNDGSTAIRISRSSQLFGYGMINILNDNATALEITLPGGGQTVGSDFLIDWQILNAGATLVNFILELSADLGQTWSQIASAADLQPDDSYLWDTSGLQIDTDYILYATLILDNGVELTIESGVFQIAAAEDPGITGTPEPSTLLLVGGGLLGLFGLLRRRKGLLSLLIAGLLIASMTGGPVDAATISVNDTTDNLTGGDGKCTLREAIMNANADADTTSGDCAAGTGADDIDLPAGTYTLALAGTGEDANATGDLDITDTDPLTITGASAYTTIVDADSIDRGFHIAAAADVTFNQLTIRNGDPGNSAGGGIYQNAAGGTLTVNSSRITGNTAGTSNGGGIYKTSNGDLTINNSTIDTNSAGRGGGIAHFCAAACFLNLNNSTISTNTSSGPGGAALEFEDGPITGRINNSTFSSNIGIALFVALTPTATLKNSIVTKSTGDECSVLGTLTLNTSLVDDVSCGAGTTPVSDFIDVLADNGGPTPTHEIYSSSNAVDVGFDSCKDHTGTPLATDQRGVERPYPTGGTCDIGAFEENSRIDLGGSTRNWLPNYKANNHDFFQDSQTPNAERDFVGDTDHPDLYMKYFDDGIIGDESDDKIAFRMRVSGDKGSDGSYQDQAFIGVDADNNGDIDAFISIFYTAAGGGNNYIGMFDPGAKENISPNTTSFSSSASSAPAIPDILADATNFAFVAVDGTTDPDATSVDLDGGTSGTDYFIDFIMPFQNIKTLLQTRHTEPPGGAIPGDVVPIVIDKNTLLRLVLLSSTQANAINGDISGIQGGVNSTITWEDLGVFSDTSFGNQPPAITSDGGGDTAAVIYSSGAVTTVTATDPEGKNVTYSISGGADQALFVIDPISGLLTFSGGAPAFDPNNGANNQYEVEVTADDGEAGANTDTQVITVVITDTSGPTPGPTNTYGLTGALTITSPVMGDLNDDGQLEIVFSDGDRLAALEAGGLRDIVIDGDGIQFSGVPVLTDSDGDNDYEVYGVTTVGKLYGRNCTGTGVAFACVDIFAPIDLAAGPLNISNVSPLASPVIGDIDGDKTFEIVLSGDDNAATPTAYLAAYELNGTQVGSKEQEIQHIVDGAINVPADANDGLRTTALAIADVDNDGTQEIFVGYNRMDSPAAGDITGEIAKYRWGAAPTLVATYRLPDNVQIGSGGTFGLLNSAPSLGDIIPGAGWDGMEVVIGGSDGKVYLASADDGGVVTGALIVSYNTGSTTAISSSPAISDLNDDGKLDVIVTNNDGRIYAFNGEVGPSFPELPGWTGGLATGSQPAISPTVGDVDSDEELEVVTAQMSTGKLFVINGNGTYEGTIINATGTDEALNGTVAIGDIDRDGDYELVTADETPQLYNWHATDEIPVSTIISWNYHRGNAHRSGALTTVNFNPIKAGTLSWNTTTRVWKFNIQFENTGTGDAYNTAVKLVGVEPCVLDPAVIADFDGDSAVIAGPINPGALTWFGDFQVNMSQCAPGDNNLIMYFDIVFEDQWGSEYLIHR